METNQPSGSQERRASDYLSGVPGLINAQEYDKALKQIDQALAIQPGNAKAHEYKKQVLVLKGRKMGSSPPPASEQTGDEKQNLQNRKQEKLRELEEERRRLEKIRQEFEELQRKEEELRRKEEMQHNRRIEEQKRAEAQRRWEAEQRRKQEELAKNQEEQERRKREEDRSKQEELRRIEEEQKRQEELRKKKQEEERRQKIQDLQSQIEVLKTEEQQKSVIEEESRKKQGEEQERTRREQLRQREEQERVRKENQRKQEEQERKKQEELKQKEEELRKREMEHAIMMDPMRRLETEARLAKEKKERILSGIAAAESLFNAGNLEEAWVAVTRILKADPSFPRALTLRLRIKQTQDKQKKPEEPIKTEAVDRKPELVPMAETEIVEKKKSQKVLIWAGVAVLCVIVVCAALLFGRKSTTAVGVSQNKKTGGHEMGNPAAETIGKSNTHPSTPPLPATAEAHVARAGMYARQKRYRAALREYDNAIALAPPIREVFAAKAEIDLMVGEYSDAIKMLSQAIELAPQDTSVLMTVALAHQLNGAAMDGFKYHELVMSLIKDSARYLAGPIADAIMCNKSLLPRYSDRVLNAFERILGAHPNGYADRYRCARLLMVLGRTKEANVLFQNNRDMLIEEFRNHPDDGRVMIELALAMTQLGHFSEAEGFANDAKNFGRTYPEIPYKIAELYAVQMQLSKGEGLNVQLKKKALQALHDAVSLHFMLGELTNADLCSLFSSREFRAAIHVSQK